MLGKFWLGVRSVAMTVLFPGTVVGYLPYRILAPVTIPGLDEWSWAQYAGTGAVAVGAVILLWCIWEFAHRGRGTLAPFDEPRKFVVQGLYRYVRNPMYVGVVLILLGESSFFWSGPLLLYTILFFVAFNIFVMAYEEPRLRSKFGAEYEQYCTRIGRWVPSLRRGSSVKP
jgi:protein-S-isoprenylcysteine O-methyltransferase Ste14